MAPPGMVMHYLGVLVLTYPTSSLLLSPLLRLPSIIPLLSVLPHFIKMYAIQECHPETGRVILGRNAEASLPAGTCI